MNWFAQECVGMAAACKDGLDEARTSEEQARRSRAQGLHADLKVKSDLSEQETQLKMPNSTNPRSRPDDTAPKYHSENAFIL